MRSLKILASIVIILLLLGGAAFGYLFKTGFFTDPQIALRSLKKQEIAANSASVHDAATKGDFATLSLLSRAKVDFTQVNEAGQNALHLALNAQKFKTIPLLESEGCDLNARDSAGNTPLSLAFDFKQPELASSFLTSGANANFTLPNGELALPGYYQAKRLNEVSLLLGNGADPNSPASDGQTTLSLALQDGQANLACTLIEKGANPNALILGEPTLNAVLRNWKGWQLEQSAAMRILGSLLVSGADIEKEDSKGQRPLQIALETDFRPSLELLMPRVENVSGCLWLAIQHNNVAAIKELLVKGTPVEEVGPAGDTPLLYAIRQNRPSLVTALLSAGADPDQFCNEGQRALFLALALQNNDIILTLLNHENKPSLNVIMEETVSEEFRTLYGKTQKSQLDWYCRNETGLTSLMFAVLIKNLPAAERMIALGMDKNQGTAKPGVVYPIQMAAKNGDVKMQQLILGVPYADDQQARKFVIDLSSQKVTYYEHGEVKKTSRISSGQRGHRTPTGEFVITDKDRNHRSNLYGGAKMNYFQRFSCRAEGFHEGYTGSSFASHGCVRLPRSTAQFFWKHTKVGDRVTIQQ